MKRARFWLITGLSLISAACGQSGDLYLPPEPSQESAQPAPAEAPEPIREPAEESEAQKETPKEAP